MVSEHTIENCPSSCSRHITDWEDPPSKQLDQDFASLNLSNYSELVPTHSDSKACKRYPESQQEWQDVKERIRQLYMVENLPLRTIKERMLMLHGFSATERMYKRQFLKWNWRKYSTKTSHLGLPSGEIGERPHGKTCRRPARRKIGIALVPNGPVVANSMTACDRGDQLTPIPSGILLHANTGDRQTYGLYVSFRDLVSGTAELDPGWKNSSKFVFPLIPPMLDHLNARFILANRLYKNQDFSRGGAVLRQGFGLLGHIISKDSLAICESLLFDIPYWMPTWEITVIYLRYLAHLLHVRNTELPMFKMASSMVRLSERFPDQLFPAIRQITNIKADLYMDIRGENDLITLAARLESLGIDEGNRLQRYNNVFASYNKFLDFAVSRFGESSDEAINIENAQLLSLQWSKNGLEIASGLCERHVNRLRLASGTPHLVDWGIERLNLLQQVKSMLYRLLIKSGELERGVSCLRESIQASECLQEKCKNGNWCPRTTCDLWQDRKQLADHLSSLGRTKEAEATRKLISPPEYVRWLLRNDEEENPIIVD